MKLEVYQKKRNFQKTTEPKKSLSKPHSGELKFVVHEHHARHLHYDFRLEAGGVLKSWAIPKGPSLDPSDKRLAIQVEDHPFDYITFQGTIPEGNYGAGTVKIWDKGTYSVEGANSRKENEQLMEIGLNKGHLKLIINGKKLKGEFSLVKIKGSKENQWLLIKTNDEYAEHSESNEEIKSKPSQKKNRQILRQ